MTITKRSLSLFVGGVILLAVASFTATPLLADNILSITSTAGHCSGGNLTLNGAAPIYGTGWTQTTMYSSVSITIQMSSYEGIAAIHSDGSPITAYLMNQIGTGTTTANQIATGTFVSPAVTTISNPPPT